MPITTAMWLPDVCTIADNTAAITMSMQQQSTAATVGVSLLVAILCLPRVAVAIALAPAPAPAVAAPVLAAAAAAAAVAAVDVVARAVALLRKGVGTMLAAVAENITKCVFAKMYEWWVSFGLGFLLRDTVL